MHRTEPTTERIPDERPVPPCIAFLLRVVGVLLRYGRQLDDALPAKAAHPRFPTLAAGFGTHDVRRILFYIQRGILRATMLERFLLARAAQGHDIDSEQPPEPAEQAEIQALDLKLRAPVQPRLKSAKSSIAEANDPLHFAMPTLKELESQIRRRSVGRTIAEICMDLGVTPTMCEGATWDEILRSLMYFGANLAEFFEVQQRRRETFQAERAKRSDRWTFDWQDRPRDAIRQLLGSLLGDPPPDFA